MSSPAFSAPLFALFVVVGILVGAAIGAVVLRAAIALYNRITGTAKSLAGIPEPSIGKAMGIVFLTTLVNLIAAFLILFVTGVGVAAVSVSGKWIGHMEVLFPICPGNQINGQSVGTRQALQGLL